MLLLIYFEIMNYFYYEIIQFSVMYLWFTHF